MATPSRSATRAHASDTERRARRAQFWVIFALFFGLGLNTGVWATLLADLSAALALHPDTLGFALASFSCAGIVLLVAGGFLADHVRRRLLALLGVGGVGLFLLALTSVASYPQLLVTLLLGGACGSCYDLAVNTLGGDYERRYATRVMTLLHAGFSAGAACGALGGALALASGVGFRAIYAGVGGAFLLVALTIIWLPLPPREQHASAQALVESGVDAAVDGASSPPIERLLTPIVVVATLLVCLAFFTDGALEGYTSVYLRGALGSGALLGGLGLATFYTMGLLGRLGSAGALRRFGERAVITFAGALSASGLTLALATTRPVVVVLGLLVVGLGQAPIVPTAFSLAARTPARSARAVAFVNTCGYTVFLVGPPLVGSLARWLSLRGALLLTIAASVGVALVAQRIPRRHAASYTPRLLP